MLIMVPREIYTTGDSTQLNINFPLNYIAIDVDMTIVEDFLLNFFFIGNNLFIIFMAAKFHILQYLYLNHISQCKISVYFAKKKRKKKKPKIFFFFYIPIFTKHSYQFVSVHICTIIVALLYISIILQTLMWVFFG